jgi:hypothetical protein
LNFFATYRKCFPSKIKIKYFPENQVKFPRNQNKRYSAIKGLEIKFDIINKKKQDIFKFFTTYKKCFPSKIKGKYFSKNQVKCFFDWKVLFINYFFNNKQTLKNLESNL